MNFLKIARVLFLTLSTAALFGCATAPGPMFQDVRATAADSGSVYVYRRDRLFASGEKFDVSIDKKVVGAIYNASFLTLDVAPGKHTVTVRPELSQGYDRDVNVEAGKTYFFEMDINGGLLANPLFIGSEFVERTQEDALPTLKLLKSAK